MVLEALFLSNVLADFLGCGGRIHRDSQAPSSCKDDLDRDVLLGLDGLGTDRWSLYSWVPELSGSRGSPSLSLLVLVKS